MSKRTWIVLLLSGSFISSTLFASSHISKKDLGVSRKDCCQIEAEFLDENHIDGKETRVFWNFHVRQTAKHSSALCPSLGTGFQLAVRGADYNRVMRNYVYGPMTQVPRQHEIVNMCVKKLTVNNTFTHQTYDEWIRINE